MEELEIPSEALQPEQEQPAPAVELQAPQPETELAPPADETSAPQPRDDQPQAPEGEPDGPQAEAELPTNPAANEAGQVSVEELMAGGPRPEAEQESIALEDAQLRAVLEAVIYVTEEPLTTAQISAALGQPVDRIRGLLDQLVAEFDKPEHGLTVREVAGGFKMATKPEHHDAVRAFVKSLKPPLKLSLPALETLAVIAYKQPVTGPEIMEIRGVQGAGVLKTLLDRKLIAVAGRKNVIGKPMLYRTTKEFLIQFGLKDLSELPSLKEFEEIRRLAFDGELPLEAESAAPGGVSPMESAGPSANSGETNSGQAEAPVPPEPEPESGVQAAPEMAAPPDAEPPSETQPDLEPQEQPETPDA